jgi:hypothetical protein
LPSSCAKPDPSRGRASLFQEQVHQRSRFCFVPHARGQGGQLFLELIHTRRRLGGWPSDAMTEKRSATERTIFVHRAPFARFIQQGTTAVLPRSRWHAVLFLQAASKQRPFRGPKPRRPLGFGELTAFGGAGAGVRREGFVGFAKKGADVPKRRVSSQRRRLFHPRTRST